VPLTTAHENREAIFSSVSKATMSQGILTRFALQRYREMRNFLVQARHVRHTGAVVWRITSQGTGGQAMLPDERDITVEDPHG
jgi:hypothetical protein